MACQAPRSGRSGQRHPGDDCAEDIKFGLECLAVIQKVKDIMDEVPILHHAKTEHPKNIYLVIGNYACAATIT